MVTEVGVDVLVVAKAVEVEVVVKVVGVVVVVKVVVEVAEVVIVEVVDVAYSSHISGILPTGGLFGPDLHPLQGSLSEHEEWRRQALGEAE